MPELTAWDSFYVIVGSAAGALIGLQFVVVTLIAERPPLRVEEAGAAFATPTIVHFSAALLLFRVDGRQARNNLCAITSSRQNVERGTRNVEFRSSEERQQEKQSLAAGGPKRVSRIADLLGESAHMRDLDAAERRDFLRTGLFAAGTALWSGTFFQTFASADEKRSPAEANTISRRELLKGLDGMSRVAEKGNDPFFGGHNAAAVMAAAFFAREEKLDERTQKEIRSLIEARLLTSPIYAPRPNETADPELGENLVKDLDAGIDTLRRSGHNIIFTNICLKALREVPEAATPQRVNGLRKMVQSFGARKVAGRPLENKDRLVDLRDETKFIHFIFEEYLKALDLYLNGKGHHGFAGHLLTVGHALIELKRAGYKETAEKGVEAYWKFVQQARAGADLGGEKVKEAPPKAPSPVTWDYWAGQVKRQAPEIVSSHLIKYPYSFFALAKELRDNGLKQRLLEQIYHLTAVS